MKRNDSSGFTLIELLISSGLSLIVLGIGAGIFVNGIRTQEIAQTVTTAANTAQQVVRSIQTGVRNASAITVTSDPVAGTQLLMARTVGSDPRTTAASCQAWYYTPTNGGSVYTKRTTPASVIALPSGGPQGIWTLLGSGISPSDPATGKVFNAPSGGRVELKFDVAAGSHPYVLMNTMTYISLSATVSSPCF
ncbi:MAG: type II secretion system protein [Actinobacteria bacterium]|nr:type II secretion system protein [Actinomycetota bacterium]